LETSNILWYFSLGILFEEHFELTWLFSSDGKLNICSISDSSWLADSYPIHSAILDNRGFSEVSSLCCDWLTFGPELSFYFLTLLFWLLSIRLVSSFFSSNTCWTGIVLGLILAWSLLCISLHWLLIALMSWLIVSTSCLTNFMWISIYCLSRLTSKADMLYVFTCDYINFKIINIVKQETIIIKTPKQISLNHENNKT